MDIGSVFRGVLLVLVAVPSYVRLSYTTVRTYTNLTVSQIRCNLDGKEFLSRCGGQYSECVKKFDDAGTRCTGDTCLGFCVFETQGNGYCSGYKLPRQAYDQHHGEPPQQRYLVPGGPAQLTIEQPCSIQ